MGKKLVSENYQCPNCGSYYTHRLIYIKEFMLLIIFLMVFIVPFLANLFIAVIPVFGALTKKCLIITSIWALLGGKIMYDFVFSISTMRCFACNAIFEIEEE